MSESKKTAGQTMMDQMLSQMTKNVEEAQKSWRRAAETMMPTNWPSQNFSGEEMGKSFEQFRTEMTAQMEANKALARSMAELAQKQQALMMEIGQSLQTTMPTGEQAGQMPAMRIRPEKVDAVFEKAIDLVQHMGETMVSSQVDALNMMRRYAAQSADQANMAAHKVEEAAPAPVTPPAPSSSDTTSGS